MYVDKLVRLSALNKYKLIKYCIQSSTWFLVCLSVCLCLTLPLSSCVCLPVCLPTHPPTYLYFSLFLCLQVWVSVWLITCVFVSCLGDTPANDMPQNSPNTIYHMSRQGVYEVVWSSALAILMSVCLVDFDRDNQLGRQDIVKTVTHLTRSEMTSEEIQFIVGKVRWEDWGTYREAGGQRGWRKGAR